MNCRASLELRFRKPLWVAAVCVQYPSCSVSPALRWSAPRCLHLLRCAAQISRASDLDSVNRRARRAHATTRTSTSRASETAPPAVGSRVIHIMMVLVTICSHSYIIPVCLSTRYNNWLASIMVIVRIPKILPEITHYSLLQVLTVLPFKQHVLETVRRPLPLVRLGLRV